MQSKRVRERNFRRTLFVRLTSQKDRLTFLSDISSVVFLKFYYYYYYVKIN